MAEKGVVDIRLRLKGKVRERFLEIKNAKGLENKTEVCRLIINEYFEKIFQIAAKALVEA